MRDFFLGKDEAVIVNGDIKVTVIDIDGDGDEVTLAIDIPEWMGIRGNRISPRHGACEHGLNFFRVLISLVFGWKEAAQSDSRPCSRK